MIKKIFTSLLLLTAVFAFTGCGDDETPEQPDWGQLPGGGDDNKPDEGEDSGTTEPRKPEVADNNVVAHRGGSAEAGKNFFPDNSIMALDYAISLKLFASECDIYRTKDDRVIVAHADSNCRINGLHPWEATLEQIQKAGTLANGETIPSLEDYIDYVLKYSECTVLWLDLKNITQPEAHPEHVIKVCELACKIILEKKAQHFCEFICTGSTAVWPDAYVIANNAKIPIGWMAARSGKEYSRNGYPWANLSTEYIMKEGTAGKFTIDEYIDNKVELSVYNVDSDADIKYYVPRGNQLKAICTNYPKKVLDAMNK